jgi:hypothetical protein
MLQSLWDLLTSNKFKVALFSILALVCAHYSAGTTWSEVLSNAWPIVVAYLGAQGLADFGKNKVIAEQRAIDKRQKDTGCCKQA